MVDPVLQTTFACALAVLFASTAMHKVRSMYRFRARLAAYRLLPAALVPLAAPSLVMLETALAAGLLLPGTRPLAAPVALATLLGYGAAIAVNLVRGHSRIDCGCGEVPRQLSVWLVARNAVLALAALVAALPPVDRPVTGVDVLLGVIGVVALVALYLLGELLLARADALREWDQARD